MTATQRFGAITRCGVLPLLLALGACAADSRPAAIPAPASEITYETGPCFGTCPVYSVTVRSSGQGMFEGKRFTAVEGRREFTVDAATYTAFSRALAAARTADPTAYVPGGKSCRQQATDHPSVTVTFRDGSAAQRTFPFYYGCRDAGNAALATALRDATKTLPIAGFIGSK